MLLYRFSNPKAVNIFLQIISYFLKFFFIRNIYFIGKSNMLYIRLLILYDLKRFVFAKHFLFSANQFQRNIY